MDLHLSGSCLALQAVCASLQTMLGPNKSLKCYLSHDGDSAILGDTLQVLDALMSSYTEHSPPPTQHHHLATSDKPHPSLDHTHPPPALQLLHECCHEHQTRVGCGVTTLICLTAYWGAEILDLANQNIPLPVIFAMFKEALSICIKHLDAMLIKVPRKVVSPMGADSSRNGLSSSRKQQIKKSEGCVALKKHSKILSFSRHFSPAADTKRGEEGVGADGVDNIKPTKETALGYSPDFLRTLSKKLGGGREIAMGLAVDAVLLKGRAGSSANIGLPLHYEMLGKHEKQSRIVRGVVSTLHSDMQTVAQDLTDKELRILLISGDCTPYSTHLGLQKRAGHVTSHDLSQLLEENQETKWLNESVAVLKQFEIGVLAVGGSVWPSLWQRCIGDGILVVRDVPSNSFKVLAKLSRTHPLDYLTQCRQESVGKGISIEILESGWTRSRFNSSATKGVLPTSVYCCRLFKDPPSPALPSLPPASLPPSAVLTALLCGVTQYGIDNLVHQFRNCWQRLHWATEGVLPLPPDATPTTLKLLPGAGLSEAACIRKLEAEASRGVDSSQDNSEQHSDLPLYFTSSWANDRFILNSNYWKQHVYQAFANGLRRYLTACVMSHKPDVSLHEAWLEVESMTHPVARGVPAETGMGNADNIETWTTRKFVGMGMEDMDGDAGVFGMRTGNRDKTEFEIGMRNSNDTSGGLLGIGNGNMKDETTRETFGTGIEFDVLDVAVSKKAAWSRAVHLLETIFLSKRVLIRQ